MTRSVNHFRTSDRARRYNVVTLAAVLCVWLVAAAMHLHVNEQDANIADSAHCAYCLALSTSAAPAPEWRLPIVMSAPAAVVACDDRTVEDQTPASFYFSRGPPAV